MRSNHLSVVLFSLVALPLVACGGDDDGGGKVVIPDAKVFMDAPPPPPPCLLESSYPAFTLPSQGRATNDWIRVGTSGPLQGVTYFGITIILDDPGLTDVTFIVPKPGVGWDLDVPYAFVTDPNATQAEAISFAGENDAAGNPTRTLWPSNGTITFSEIGQNQGDNVTVTVSATNYREVDDDGNDVPNGCTTSFGGITMNLTQATTVALAPFLSKAKVDAREAAKAERVTVKR